MHPGLQVLANQKLRKQDGFSDPQGTGKFEI
jgi:hypothetical protein